MKRAIAVAAAITGVAAIPGFLPADAGDAATTTTTFRATSANIRCDPPNPAWMTRHDTRLVKNQLGGIIGTQENCSWYPDRISTNPPIQRIILDTLGPNWGHYIPKARAGYNTGPHEVPIFWYKPNWHLVNHGYVWIARARAAAWVRLRHTTTRRYVVRVNTHWTNGAWKPDATDTRKHEWQDCQLNTERLVRTLHARFPHAPLIIGGDFNYGDDPANANVLPDLDVSYDIVDKPILLAHLNQPAGNTTATKELRARPDGPLYTDHPAVEATYTVTP